MTEPPGLLDADLARQVGGTSLEPAAPRPAGTRATEERALRTEAIVWICSECFEPYDARPPGGHCLNAGHAPVKVFRARVHPIRARRGVRVVPLRPNRA